MAVEVETKSTWMYHSTQQNEIVMKDKIETEQTKGGQTELRTGDHNYKRNYRTNDQNSHNTNLSQHKLIQPRNPLKINDNNNLKIN